MVMDFSISNSKSSCLARLLASPGNLLSDEAHARERSQSATEEDGNRQRGKKRRNVTSHVSGKVVRRRRDAAVLVTNCSAKSGTAFLLFSADPPRNRDPRQQRAIHRRKPRR